eukprot:SAG31_NODE_61_length_29286_cov_444.645973_7_plen_96_part_00
MNKRSDKAGKSARVLNVTVFGQEFALRCSIKIALVNLAGHCSGHEFAFFSEPSLTKTVHCTHDAAAIDVAIFSSTTQSFFKTIIISHQKSFFRPY